MKARTPWHLPGGVYVAQSLLWLGTILGGAAGRGSSRLHVTCGGAAAATYCNNNADQYIGMIWYTLRDKWMREMPAADRSCKAIPHGRSRISLDVAKERKTLVTSTYLPIKPIASHFWASPTSRLWNGNRPSLSHMPTVHSPKYGHWVCGNLTSQICNLSLWHVEDFPPFKMFSRIFPRRNLISWFCNYEGSS